MNLAGIQHLFTHDGPFVNLHLDVSRDDDAAGRGMETRWTNIRHTLGDAGVDPGLLDRIRELVLQPTGVPSPARRTVVAAGGDVLLDDVRMGHGAWPEVTGIGPLPDVSGWVTQVDGEFPFVLVIADREGADVDVYRSLMALADDRKVLTDNDLRAVIATVRSLPLGSADVVDPFDTPSAAVHHGHHEAGYGHGV